MPECRPTWPPYSESTPRGAVLLRQERERKRAIAAARRVTVGDRIQQVGRTPRERDDGSMQEPEGDGRKPLTYDRCQNESDTTERTTTVSAF